MQEQEDDQPRVPRISQVARGIGGPGIGKRLMLLIGAVQASARKQKSSIEWNSLYTRRLMTGSPSRGSHGYRAVFAQHLLGSAYPASASQNSSRTAFEIWQCLRGREASPCRMYYSGTPTHRISMLFRILPG